MLKIEFPFMNYLPGNCTGIQTDKPKTLLAGQFRSQPATQHPIIAYLPRDYLRYCVAPWSCQPPAIDMCWSVECGSGL